jgi:hypothetical protein
MNWQDALTTDTDECLYADKPRLLVVLQGQPQLASRAVWQSKYGETSIPEGMQVFHTCSQTKNGQRVNCLNLRHMYLGDRRGVGKTTALIQAAAHSTTDQCIGMGGKRRAIFRIGDVTHAASRAV